jgi:hypothetical protein
MIRAGEPTAIYIPQHGPAAARALRRLTTATAAHGLAVVDIVWSWRDLVQLLASGEVQLAVATSAADLPPGRRPRLVMADQLPAPGRPRRWLR